MFSFRKDYVTDTWIDLSRVVSDIIYRSKTFLKGSAGYAQRESLLGPPPLFLSFSLSLSATTAITHSGDDTKTAIGENKATAKGTDIVNLRINRMLLE